MINLMGNELMTDHQISKRVVALIRQRFSLDDEQKLTRINIGSSQNRYTLSTAEIATIDAYEAHVIVCRDVGIQAKLDRDALSLVIDHEHAVERLKRPALIAADYPDVDLFDTFGKVTGATTNPALVTDASERTAAQATVDAATPETLALVVRRTPVVTPKSTTSSVGAV